MNFGAGSSLKSDARARYIIAKLLATEMADAVVEVALAGDLVSPVSNFADQFGHLVGDGSQNVKRRRDVVLGEEIKSFVCVRLDSALEPVPAVCLNNTLEWGDVKVILNDDRQQV